MGACRSVPAAPAERPLSVQLRDIRRNARQWARSADSGPSRLSPPNGQVRPKADPTTKAACAFLAPRPFSDQSLSALKAVR